MKSLRLSVMILLVVCGCFASVFGQSDRGTIRGTVTDPNGAAVVGATVSANNIETNDKRDVTSSSDGIFVFPELKAGLYQVTISASGFNPTNVENVKVDVQGIQSLEIKLEVGAVTGAVVTVNAEAVSINSDNPVRQTTVTERQVRELPLQVSSEAGGRSPLSFIFLDSNVGASDQSGGSNASKFRVSGGQASGTEILIDGASTRRTQNGNFFSEVAPGPNAYQEFTVSTNSYSAEFGNSSGGVINFTLKSGTNQFHGEAYDLLRNEKLNANSFYNNANNLKRNRDNENNYGFNVGGPIFVPHFGEGGPFFHNLKDRAFFFFNYERYRFIQGVNTLQSVPTVRERNGDFGELLTDPYVLATTGPIQIYDPRQPVDSRDPIPNNRLDLVNSIINGRALLDPAGVAILSFYPLPTRAGVHNNYESTIAVPATSRQYQVKTDFNLSQQQHLNFSFSRRINERICCENVAPVLPLPFVQAFGPFQQTFTSYISRVQHDYTITPSLINHINVGYTYYNTINGNTTLGFDTSSLGIPRAATSNVAFPLIDFVGDGNNGNSPKFTTDIGGTDFSDHIRDATLELSDSVTYILGRQTFKFGATIRRNQYNVQQLIHPGGRFGFHQDQTRRDGDAASGSPLASLITGATEWSFQGNDQVDPAFRQMTQGYFVQDDIKLTSKLTLNLGLRYDLPGARNEAHDRFRTFDPDVVNPAIGRAGAIIGAAGQGGLQAPFRSLSPQDKSNIGPRLGAAYALNSKTVVRGGIGLYYAPLIYGVGGNGSLKDGTIGYNYDDYLTTPGAGAIPTQWLSTFQPLPTSNNIPGTQAVGTNSTVPYFDKNFKTGRSLQYTFDVQRELPYRFVASVGYIGHHDDRLRSNFGRLNALPLNDLKLGFPILSKRFNDLTAVDRAYASSIGINIPTTANGVFTGFDGGCGDVQCTVAQALKPFPQYGRIDNYLESQGSSNYNAVQVKLDRRFAQGFSFGLAYTFSKLITNASEDILGGSPLDSSIQNPFDRAPLKTTSPTNSPHVFVANFLAELPFGKGKKYLDHGGFINALFGGFQVSGIFRYQAGVPLVVTVSPDTGATGNSALDNWTNLVGYYTNLRPNLTGQSLTTVGPCINIAPERDRRFSLNCGAFAFPADFTRPTVTDPSNPAYAAYYSDPTRFFGNSPVVNTDFRSPMYFSENMNILKKTRFTETVFIEVGLEAFNLFNRSRFLQPDGNLGRFVGGRFDNGNFGQEGVAQPVGPFGGNRVVQLRARLVF